MPDFILVCNCILAIFLDAGYRLVGSSCNYYNFTSYAILIFSSLMVIGFNKVAFNYAKQCHTRVI